MAAICRKCGVDVGCGCNLVDGLCASCRYGVAQGIIQPLKRIINGLFGC